MAGFVSRLMTRLSKLCLTVLIAGSSLYIHAYSLKNEGLSQNVADYSSINYQYSGQSKRQLSYLLNDGKTPLTLQQQGADYRMVSGLNSFQTLFNGINKQADYQKFKQGFIDQTSLDKQADYTQELTEVDNEVNQLSSKLKQTQDSDHKQAINEDLEDLYQQQRNLRKAINGVKRKQSRLLSLPVYSLNEVFAKARSSAFFLVDTASIYYVKPQKTKQSYQDALSKQTLSIKQFSYELESKIEFNQPTKLKSVGKSILITRYYQDTLLSFSYGAQTAYLNHIQDDTLNQLAKMLNTTPLEPKRLAFKGETLTTKYVWAESGKQKILEVTYKETGKRKNLIQVKASAQTNVFDPKQSSNAIEKHIGVLAQTKNGRLLELKKVQTINGKKDIGWDQDVRNGLIKLADEKIFVNKQDYYGYEGLWYLASWMSSKGVKEKKIFLINGTEPISLTASLTNNNQVEITKAGNLLYQFQLDSNGFVTRLYFAPSKQTLSLISKETPTTASNKAKVKHYMKANKIVLL